MLKVDSGVISDMPFIFLHESLCLAGLLPDEWHAKNSNSCRDIGGGLHNSSVSCTRKVFRPKKLIEGNVSLRFNTVCPEKSEALSGRLSDKEGPP